MITSILINALGQAIFESFGQALLIYIGLQLFFQLFPGIGSNYRYDINYLGLTIITCWFLANLVKIYVHDASLPHYGVLLYNSGLAHGTKTLPTLLQQAESFIIKYAQYITGLYMIGLMLHCFKLLGGLVNINQIRKQKNLSADNEWSAKTNLLVKNLGIVRKVSLYFSEHIQIPLTIGHFKPIVIFPLALINNLDTDQVEAILLHELAHVKRHDYLLNILQCIMDTILCFNPFSWLISKNIRQEREYCCDDMVVDAEYNNFTYSKALFIIAQQNKQNYALAMASANTNKYPLLNRIKRLNTMKTNDSLPKFHLLVIVAVAAIGALLTWGIPQYSVAKTTSHKMTKTPVCHLSAPAAPAPPAVVVEVQPSAPAPPPSPRKIMIFHVDTAADVHINDTAKHTKKFSIVMRDDKGNRKEYHSVDEMPEPVKSEFLKENEGFGDMDSDKIASIKKLTNSPEWRKQMFDMKVQMDKQFNNPQWKKQVIAMQVEARKMAIKANSPEFKKQVAKMQAEADKMKIQFDSPEFKKQMEDIQVQIKDQANNPEFKKQMEDMQIKIKAQFDSPEWKKQVKDMQKQAIIISKQVNSKAWKVQVDDMKKQSEEMAKKLNNPEFKKEMEDMQKKIKDEVDRDMKKADEDTTKSGN
ncbi:M56 family metallopeptidase [Mucilaginibacter sp. X5P1]|uniref:M56 family metallopeptidase n=1 Tax=Mucilaginibacter sp. X5P1 TaxID=2723088 RepID=UPI001618998C|nr:M56 family metallopeptidase [Mucilaginibacter sp. X5P1]MBB6141168.1 beta-lactamase regulating signal transducer with metallopeptidase domain [Mucilaginibacter sp. X5P1]